MYELDTTILKSNLELAQLNIKQNEDQYSNLLKGKKPQELDVIKKQLKQAEFVLDNAKKDYERYKQLIKNNFISKSDLDDKQTNYNVAKSKVEELKASLKVAQLGARAEEVKTAEINIELAKQKYLQAKKVLDEAMPTNGFEVMIGKISPYILICYIQASIILVLAKVLFSVSALGSIGLIYFTLLIFIICNLCIGFCISSVSKNQTQASQMATMVFYHLCCWQVFCFHFLECHYGQSIGNLLPLTYFLKIPQSIILKGATFMEIWPNLLPLLIFMIAIITLTSKFYKKTLD